MNDVGSHVWSNSDWKAIDPHDVGLSTEALYKAVAYHRSEEADADRDLAKGLNSVLGNTEQAKWAEVLGPTRPRGDPNGLVMRHGKLAMAWGDTERVDMTFSATKSYLAVVAGVAIEKGLIQNIDEPLRNYALDDGFEAEQNHNITWRQILQQASEWEGTLWDKPDLVDRNREVGPSSDNSMNTTTFASIVWHSL